MIEDGILPKNATKETMRQYELANEQYATESANEEDTDIMEEMELEGVELQGKRATRKRNERKKTADRLERMIANGVLPVGATKKMMREYELAHERLLTEPANGQPPMEPENEEDADVMEEMERYGENPAYITWN